ncbi:MAG: cytochrome P460 family protein [Armatimonadetes bacterium]|nr:cytochrome P460 family protein [Armatimonadota bacterium]
MNLALGFALTTTAIAVLTPTEKPDHLKLIRGYRDWTRVTSQPVDMSYEMSGRCSPAPPPHGANNPHIPMVYLVYVNQAGRKDMLKKSGPLPDGTVIVKEKYKRSAFAKKEIAVYKPVDTSKWKSLKPELLTVMIKRDGKWTYLGVDKDGQEFKGSYSACARCHATTKETDSVFTNRRPMGYKVNKLWPKKPAVRG